MIRRFSRSCGLNRFIVQEGIVFRNVSARLQVRKKSTLLTELVGSLGYRYVNEVMDL
jgi:hypothetical protein